MSDNDHFREESKRGNGDPWKGLSENTPPRPAPKEDRPFGGTPEQKREGGGDPWKGLR